jgi:hypothetical protein
MNAEQYRALVNKLEQINEKVTLNPDGTAPQTQQFTTPSGATFTGNAPTATPGTPPPPATPAGPVKSQANYNMALQQIKSLYAKAQVAYPPQDDIVRTRFGLPPALPPFEQWDGKMPQAGEADWMTRNILGRQASKDISQQNKANTLSATSGAQVDQNNIANVAKLKDLVAKLSAASAPAAAAAPTATPGTPPPPPAGTMSAESTDLRSALAKMLKEDFNIDMAEAGEDKQALIKQIQDLMAQINSDNENPEPEVAQALQDAQTAIDTANAAQAEKEKEIGANQDQEDADMGAAMTANAQAEKEKEIGANQDAEDQAIGQAMTANATPATPQAGQAAPANQTFGQAFKAARASGAKEFDYKGKKYSTAQKGENPALDAAMAKQKAPTAPTAPSAPTAPNQSGQSTPSAPSSFSADVAARKAANAPKLPQATQPAIPGTNPQMPKSAAPLPMTTKPVPPNLRAESVGYNEDQTLARIVSLANIR